MTRCEEDEKPSGSLANHLEGSRERPRQVRLDHRSSTVIECAHDASVNKHRSWLA